MSTPAPPPKVHEQHKGENAYMRANARIAVAVTRAVGSMTCAWLFVCLALVGLPGAIESGVLGIVQWVAQTFLQLVLLSVIMVGQNVAQRAADARAEATYRDTEALLAQHAETRAVLDAVTSALAALRAAVPGATGRRAAKTVDLRASTPTGEIIE